MQKNNFYITSPIFYPNAKLHLGNLYSVTVCDILVRAHKLMGEETYFLTGADENTSKILKKIKENQSVEEYLFEISENTKNLHKELNISYDQFIRTSDKERHWPGAFSFWNKLVEAGDIYKAKYIGLYCGGCEAFVTSKDLVDEKCPFHLVAPEKIEEENYFFKLSKYTEIIKQKINQDELKIIPETRKNEIMSLLERGLEDVSFSRPIKNVPYGIPVPNDPDQVIYVWCDALVSYISALGYGQAGQNFFQKFWPADLHVIGKDILRFHAAIWPAMLISACLSLPKTILVHGFITFGGHKISKSLKSAGHISDPIELINEYGADSLRYYLAREVSLFEDSPFTLEHFKDVYNANLANGLGNLVSRTLTLSEKYLTQAEVSSMEVGLTPAGSKSDFHTALDQQLSFYKNFEIKKAADAIWEKIGELDKFIQEEEPFKIIKIDEKKGKELILKMVSGLYLISCMLEPVMPSTSNLIKKLIQENKKPDQPIFLRKI